MPNLVAVYGHRWHVDVTWRSGAESAHHFDELIEVEAFEAAMGRQPGVVSTKRIETP